MEDRAGLPSKRELIEQLIAIRLREEVKRNENSQLRIENRKLRETLREKAAQLKHARQELVKKSRNKHLSDEEWEIIRKFRGQC